MYKKIILKDNLTLVTHHMKDVFSVSVGIWLKVGSRYEKENIAGVSHLLEHVTFKGSKRYDNETIKREIEGRGGLLNGFTSEELTCYYAKVPQKNACNTFKILLDMALNPLLKPKDIQKEKTVIIEEIKMYNDLPQHMVQELLDKTMWPGHPLGRNITGTVETIGSISKDELVNFKNKYYCPENMVIAFVGNIKQRVCLDFVNKTFDRIKFQKKDYNFDRFISRQNKAQIKTLIKDIEQTKLAIGFPAYEREHPQRFILTLLAIILGGNMSSRLFNEIREKHGLAYEISSHYKQLIDTGAFYVHAGLDNKKVDMAINLILKELAKLKNNLVSDSELRRAKEFCLSQLAMNLEDTMEHMVFLGVTASTMKKILDFNQIKKGILKVTPHELKEVAKDIFRKDKINVSLVGPVSEFREQRCLDYINADLA